jgi:uncharacterized membrane protein
MADLLAALASVFWGGADFFGGFATKGLDVRRVGAVAQTTGLFVIALVLVFFPAHPHRVDLAWGLGAGVATALGVTLLYTALAVGPMYVAASVTAVVGAAANATIGLVNGERPDALALVGIPIAITSLVLVSAPAVRRADAEAVSRRVLGLAVGAGLTLGVSNACFAATSVDSGAWPVAMSRLVAAAALGLGALAVRGSGRWDRPSVGYAVAAGVTDIIATISIALALQRGPQALIGVLGSLFPVVTVALARVVLHESMSRRQAVGLVCAVLAVAMMR